MLRLPTWLFERVASRMLRIDEKARSSMADDVLLGRRTEVDAFAGTVIKLAGQKGIEVPVNRMLHALLAAIEEART